MKTENLTWAEAIRAYADGKRIRDCQNEEFWLDGDTPLAKKPNTHTYDDPGGPATLFTPYSIVIPEEKALSFEEAEKAYIEGKTLFIDTELLRNTRFLAGANGTAKEALAMFDLAERRGWKITEIQP